jgi:formylmethanofuran dehydrogenase subunit B
VLGRPGLGVAAAPAVLIPVGTPGLDHPGDLVRTDGVVTLRLGSMRDLGLPRVADVAAAIAARVGG